MKKFTNKVLFSVFMLMSSFMMPQVASAGVIGDAMATSQAGIIIKLIFGFLGGGVTGNIITDFINSQKIDNAILKAIAVGICILAIFKTNTITNLFSSF